MASHLLHLVPPARRLLRAQHVRGRRCRELSQVSRESGSRRTGAQGYHQSKENEQEEKKYEKTRNSVV